MRVAVAADHAGFPLKEMVLETVRAAGHEVLDLGVIRYQTGGLSRLCRQGRPGDPEQ